MTIVENIKSLLNSENFIVLWVGLACFSIVKMQLIKGLNDDRQKVLSKQFSRCIRMGIYASLCFLMYTLLSRYFTRFELLQRFIGVFSFIAFALFVLWGLLVVRCLSFLSAFWLNPKVPVPLLLINVFTMICSIIIVILVSTEVLKISLGPLVATSAIMSVVLGLALQETLGNLFSGISMQFDKPFKIGDWVEILINGTKTTGQVEEISWRASVFRAMTDEVIIVPNRLVAQAVVHNFNTEKGPILRGVSLKVALDIDHSQLSRVLIQAIQKIGGISQQYTPKLLVLENGEYCNVYRIIYHIADFGDHALISSEVLRISYQILNSMTHSAPVQRMVLLNSKNPFALDEFGTNNEQVVAINRADR